MKKQVIVIKLDNGRYLEDFEYSQGYWSDITCLNPWDAHDFSGKEDVLKFVLEHYQTAEVVKGTIEFIVI